MTTIEIMTSAELADYLRVPLRTLYAWRSHGGGPPGVRVGRHLRYRRADVDAWLDARQDREVVPS